MRICASYATSAIVHLAVLGSLAGWVQREASWEFAVDSGQAVTLSASVASPAPSAPPEFEAVKLEVVEPPAPSSAATPNNTPPTKQPAEPLEMLDPRSDMEVELEIAASVEAQEVSRQPHETHQPTASATPSATPTTQRPSPAPPNHSPAASVAQPAVRFAGANVDRPPRMMPANRAPDYPMSARFDRSEGRVLLRVAIDDGGYVQTVVVHESSGDYRLDEAALAAVRHWRFHPGEASGLAVAAEVLVPVRFSLRRS
jgi:protein TonB